MFKKHIKNLTESNTDSGSEKALEIDNKILDALLDDMNAPKAIGFIWDLVQDNQIGSKQKLEILKKYDQILSLNLLDFSDFPELHFEIPEEVETLAKQRWEFRSQKNFAESDRLRKLIHDKGFEVKDSKDSYNIVPLS